MADLLLRAPIQAQPKQQNRWIVRFPTPLGVQEWSLVGAARPTFEISINEMPFINTRTYVNGSFKWNAMQFTVRDWIGPSTAQAVMEYLRLAAESVTGRMGYVASYAIDVEVEMLGPAGAVVEKWVCVNSIPTGSVDFGTLNYGQDGPMEFSFSLQPQYCVLVF